MAKSSTIRGLERGLQVLTALDATPIAALHDLHDLDRYPEAEPAAHPQHAGTGRAGLAPPRRRPLPHQRRSRVHGAQARPPRAARRGRGARARPAVPAPAMAVGPRGSRGRPSGEPRDQPDPKPLCRSSATGSATRSAGCSAASAAPISRSARTRSGRQSSLPCANRTSPRIGSRARSETAGQHPRRDPRARLRHPRGRILRRYYGRAPYDDGLAAIAVPILDGRRVHGALNLLWTERRSRWKNSPRGISPICTPRSTRSSTR